MVDIQPEEFSLCSGKIGSAAVLTADGMEPMAIQNEWRWSSDAFIIIVRTKMETHDRCRCRWYGRINGAGNRSKEQYGWIRRSLRMGELWEVGLPRSMTVDSGFEECKGRYNKGMVG